MTVTTNSLIQNYYNDLCKRWNYVPTDQETTGYESVITQLRSLGKEVWSAADDAGKQKIESDVFDLYRSINVVPIFYYNLEGCRQQLLDLATKQKTVLNEALSVGNNDGLRFGRFWFENMQDAYTRNNRTVSLRSRFHDDAKLKRAIQLCYKHRDEGADAVIPKNLRRAFDLVSGGSIQNFKPMNARAIWEHVCPVMFGRVLDFSSGYGGRMMGAMTSNLRYHYTGIDPNTKTYQGLVALGELLNECNLGSGYEMHHLPSEEFDPDPGSYDAAFSSPPYFNLETYSDESTQCMNRCSNLDAWFELYVEPTLKMIHRALADHAVYAVNIADYNFDKENYQIVERWKHLSEQLGFKYEQTVRMMLNVRPGQGNNRQTNALKHEGIYIFSKK